MLENDFYHHSQDRIVKHVARILYKGDAFTWADVTAMKDSGKLSFEGVDCRVLDARLYKLDGELVAEVDVASESVDGFEFELPAGAHLDHWKLKSQAE